MSDTSFAPSQSVVPYSCGPLTIYGISAMLDQNALPKRTTATFYCALDWEDVHKPRLIVAVSQSNLVLAASREDKEGSWQPSSNILCGISELMLDPKNQTDLKTYLLNSLFAEKGKVRFAAHGSGLCEC